MIDFMLQTFGVYQPFTNIDGTVVSPDYQYIGSVVIFCICLYGTFKVLAAIFRRK